MKMERIRLNVTGVRRGRKMEEWIDEEMDNAEKAHEHLVYYEVVMPNGGTTIKLYKPSVADLLSKRSGTKMHPLQQQFIFNKEKK